MKDVSSYLFNGDSFCWGYNLKDREQRYCHKFSTGIGAEYTDLSNHGCSNRTILRTTLAHDITQYDQAIICLTFNNRTELYLNGRWEYVNMGRGSGRMFEDYYRKYYEPEYGDTDERMVYDCLRYYFQSKGVPLLLGTSAKTSKLSYDLWINTEEIIMGETGHPTAVGHEQITSKIALLDL